MPKIFTSLRPSRSILFCAATAVLALTACDKESNTGVQRMQVGSADAASAQAAPAAPATTGDPGAIPKHAAPPLSQLAGANTAGDASGADGDNENMQIQAGETKVMAGGNILQVAGIAFTVSEDWQNVKTSNNIRVAEYKLPGSGGDAEMAIFYFGKGQGGGVEDNIRRWAGQFSDPNTTQPGAQVARMERNNLRTALVKTEGTYNPSSMGGMAPAAEPKDDFALFGLVVEGGPEGSVFVKVTGPKATMAEQDENLQKMAQSVRVSDYK